MLHESINPPKETRQVASRFYLEIWLLGNHADSLRQLFWRRRTAKSTVLGSNAASYDIGPVIVDRVACVISVRYRLLEKSRELK